MSTKRELWTEYRGTWEIFSRNLYKLQELTDSGEGELAAAAMTEVKQARAEHNAARDRLAKHLAGETADVPELTIRRTARLLWEFSGKSEDTAASDWHRAEELVRSASA